MDQFVEYIKGQKIKKRHGQKERHKNGDVDRKEGEERVWTNVGTCWKRGEFTAELPYSYVVCNRVLAIPDLNLVPFAFNALQFTISNPVVLQAGSAVCRIIVENKDAVVSSSDSGGIWCLAQSRQMTSV